MKWCLVAPGVVCGRSGMPFLGGGSHVHTHTHNTSHVMVTSERESENAPRTRRPGSTGRPRRTARGTCLCMYFGVVWYYGGWWVVGRGGKGGVWGLSGMVLRGVVIDGFVGIWRVEAWGRTEGRMRMRIRIRTAERRRSRRTMNSVTKVRATVSSCVFVFGVGGWDGRMLVSSYAYAVARGSMWWFGLYTYINITPCRWRRGGGGPAW